MAIVVDTVVDNIYFKKRDNVVTMMTNMMIMMMMIITYCVRYSSDGEDNIYIPNEILTSSSLSQKV